jgi:hypothetical protein
LFGSHDDKSALFSSRDHIRKICVLHSWQVVSLAIASLRSADAEDIPLVVRFLLQSTTPGNVKRILYQLRENLHFVADSVVITQLKQQKLKGKAIMTNCEALVVEAIRSGLRFQNVVKISTNNVFLLLATFVE